MSFEKLGHKLLIFFTKIGQILLYAFASAFPIKKKKTNLTEKKLIKAALPDATTVFSCQINPQLQSTYPTYQLISLSTLEYRLSLSLEMAPGGVEDLPETKSVGW